MPSGPSPGPQSHLPPAPGSDAAIQGAIEYLANADLMRGHTTVDDDFEATELVVQEDKLLLTDYFFHLMKQLRLCRFSEADRKTRGGKRENVSIGYGGLQCVHCAGTPNSRKFFWSNVDRLANSFAEIPGHVLKCRRCPTQSKIALQELKSKHPEQMARLPRGSQKVFFRRMWRRLHDDDPQQQSGSTSASDTSAAASPAQSKGSAAKQEPGSEGGESPSAAGTLQNMATPIAPRNSRSMSGGGDDRDLRRPSPVIGPHERMAGGGSFVVGGTTEGAARALAASMALVTTSDFEKRQTRVMLAIDEDTEWLSDMDCFIRRNVEIFCSREEDVAAAQVDRKYPICEGQVGIRCIHCAVNKEGARGNAVSFPYSISGIYESVREFQRLHLEGCKNLPDDVKAKLLSQKGSASLSSVLRRYYVMAAKALGMYDTPDGIRAGGDSVALGSSAAYEFTSSASSSGHTVGTPVSGIADSMHHRMGSFGSMSGVSGGMSGITAIPHHFTGLESAVTPLESRKRKPQSTTPMSESDISGDSSSKRGRYHSDHSDF